MAVLREITGQKFGRLTAIRFLGVERRRAIWLFACECGVEVQKESRHVTSGGTASCGCYRREGHSNRQHGMKGTREYRSWSMMLNRCRNSNSVDFADYGGRGISVCDRWLDFTAFYADMGSRPEGTSIDRIDVNGNYEPGNCRWATAFEQTHNRRCSVARRIDHAV